MTFALQLALIAITLLAVYLFRPKVKGPAPATAGAFNIPKTKEGEEIGRLYGTYWFTDVQIVWHGDFTSEAIHSSEGKK